MTDDLLRSLGTLRVDHSRGNPAPHKPLLLLVVLEIAEFAPLPSQIELTPAIAFRFATYFSVVAHRRQAKPEIRMPFQHLGSSGFWVPLNADGAPSDSKRSVRTARLSDAFRAMASDPERRSAARRLLIETYFEPAEQAALYALTGLEDVRPPKPAEKKSDEELQRAESVGRSARFRIAVMAAYDFTCALTGHRLLTIDAGSIVDAAHIHPFSDSRNNEPRNGIALCKNAHWAFDEGLWSVTDEMTVLVARAAFSEEHPDGLTFVRFEGARLRLPQRRELWPNPEYVAWHRRKVFLGKDEAAI